ncbi:DUF4124 domain-containing protein [Agarivorans sp. MS3-6]
MSKWFAIFLMAGLGLINAHAANTVYQWVDKDGVTHFSDRPQTGAKELKVDVAPPATNGPLVTPRAPLKKAEKPIKYQVSITSPSHEQTIRDNEGKISISASANPVPLNGMGYKLVLDGVPQGQITNVGYFQLTNIDRGAHSIQVQLVDSSGKKLASSNPITVFLHRANANGAAAGG